MKKLFLWAAAAGGLLTGCEQVKLAEPDFTVSVDKTTYRVGAAVTFNLTGNPDIITFYSGELGRNYDQRATYTKEGGSPEMQFLTSFSGGTTTLGTQNLRVLVSSDFSGTYDTLSVRRATWTDVTSRVALSPTAANFSSGVVNLNSYKAADKPLYVAFKYISIPPYATNNQRVIRMSTFQFRVRYPDGTSYTNAATNSDSGFGVVKFREASTGSWISGTTLDHVTVPAATPFAEDWAISNGFVLNRYASDAAGGRPVKSAGLLDKTLPTYTYTYTTPGTYKAVFLAQNTTINGTKDLARDVTITVTP